jgi:hypothetical protein
MTDSPRGLGDAYLSPRRLMKPFLVCSAARTGLGRIAALRDRSDALSHCRSDALSCCRPVRPRVHSTPDWLRGSVPLLFSEAAVRPDPRR